MCAARDGDYFGFALRFRLTALHWQRRESGQPRGTSQLPKRASSGFAPAWGSRGVTPHTLRHTFGSVAGDLGFSELTIRALLGHAAQSVTQDHAHIDEALKLAVTRTCEEIASLLDDEVLSEQEERQAA